jgi:acetyl coenzyme A synthetase (ADP forming)-like protein
MNCVARTKRGPEQGCDFVILSGDLSETDWRFTRACGKPRAVSAPTRAQATDALLRDGTSIRIRFAEAADAGALNDLLSHLSEHEVADSFAGAAKEDAARQATLVAELGTGGGARLVGAARYALLPEEDGHSAHLLLAVPAAERGRGIGSLLFEHLVRAARERGVATFQADILGETNRILEVLAASGMAVRRSDRAGVLRVTFPTEETEEAIEAALAREKTAAAESLRPILSPRSVAVVGASREPGTIGHQIVRNLLDSGYTGEVFPVNPKAQDIEGLRCYPSLSALGQAVDLVVISVPARLVESVVEECAKTGARGAVVVSAGFAEVSAEGRAAQERLRDRARGAGMRLVGPNCMGVLNTDPAIAMNATFAPVHPPAGVVGFLSQSGALGLAILDYARNLHIGVSTFVSVGNKADVSGNDLLAYWDEDPRTRVIALYLESFGNPRKFARRARDVASRKPIVCVKSGRSAAGSRAAASHSAALAALDVAVDSVFDQAGVIRTGTLEELFDVVTLLATQPVPRGGRLAVVTNAGGPGILVADACEARGLSLPELTPETQARLRSFLPSEASVRNPVDMIASAVPEHYREAVAVAGADPGVDSVVVLYVPPLATRPEEIASAIAEGAGRVPAEKPVLTVFLSARGVPDELRKGPRGALPSFPFPENTAQALAGAVGYGKWLARTRGKAISLEPFQAQTIRAVIERVLAASHEPQWLETPDVVTILRAAAIPFVRSRQVAAAEAEAEAERIGYPIVAKAVAKGVLHKSDVGGVILGLESREGVARAVRELEERMRAAGTKLDAVLLQRQIEPGLDVMVGMTSDPLFGPLVVCAFGGVQVELLKDASFHLPPVTDVDAGQMIDRLRLAPLLSGYRGAPAGDRAALVDVIRRVSALTEVAPEILEMDLNPVRLLAPGQGAVAVDARIRVGKAPI